MASDNILNITQEKALEMPMVDMAFELLKLRNKQPLGYRDIMHQIAQIKGFTEEDINRVIAQLYTQMNIDGRFILLRDGEERKWGLRRWYAFTTDDATGSFRVPGFDDDEEEDDVEFEDDEEETVADVDSDYDAPYADDAEDIAADEVADDVEDLGEAIGDDEELDEELDEEGLVEEELFEAEDDVADEDDDDEA